MFSINNVQLSNWKVQCIYQSLNTKWIKRNTQVVLLSYNIILSNISGYTEQMF